MALKMILRNPTTFFEEPFQRDFRGSFWESCADHRQSSSPGDIGENSAEVIKDVKAMARPLKWLECAEFQLTTTSRFARLKRSLIPTLFFAFLREQWRLKSCQWVKLWFRTSAKLQSKKLLVHATKWKSETIHGWYYYTLLPFLEKLLVSDH